MVAFWTIFQSSSFKNDPNHTWNSWLDAEQKADAQAQNVIALYFISSRCQEMEIGQKADEALTKIQEYQKLGVKNVLPDESPWSRVEVFRQSKSLNFGY